MAESHPVEIVFRKKSGSDIAIDTIQAGVIRRDQGRVMASAPLLASLAGHVRIENASLKDILLAAGFHALDGWNADYRRFVKRETGGLYDLTIGPNLVELNWSEVSEGVVTRTVPLLLLKRSGDTVWPRDFATVEDHALVALRIVDFHRDLALAA
jgi:hypothetical protein